MQSMASWKIFINPERCIGCHACEMACEQTHGGASNIKVQCAPVFCRHCEVPPCITVCYRNAIEMRNGKILLIKDLCTNCGICIFACPFGAIMTTTITRRIEPKEKAHRDVPLLSRLFGGKIFPKERQIVLVHKCDGCVERAEAGVARPACAATCPSGAIECKDIAQASSSKRIRTYEVHLVTHLTHREGTSL